MSADPYVAAFEQIAATSRAVLAEHLEVHLRSVCIELRWCAPGQETVFTNYTDTVVFELSDESQLRPPPEGLTCIYGAAHEIGHMAVFQLCGGRTPAVVWDEALAHHLAAHLIVPELVAILGDRLWPDPHPEILAGEGTEMLAGAEGSPLGNYDASLRVLDAGLYKIRDRIGWAGLAAALQAVDPHRYRADRFGAALTRAARAWADAPTGVRAQC